MAEKKANEAVLNMVKTLQETNEKIVESAVAAQERNIKYAQNTLVNGVEVLKSQADSTLALMQSVMGQSKELPGDFQAVMDSAVAAEEQYLKFAQSTVVNGMEVLKSHAESTQALIHKMEQQTRKQQEAYQELARESAGIYMDFFRAPLRIARRQRAQQPQLERDCLEAAFE
jgi:hypothetical protein